jgi:putative ABC transport system permease protein
MIKLVLRGMATRRLRTFLTGLAVLLGVAMVAGTFIQTDRIRNAFTDLLQTATAGSDAVITHRGAFESQFGESPELRDELIEQVRDVPGVASAEGEINTTATLVVDGRVVEAEGFAGGFLFSVLPDPFDPTELEEGRYPGSSGEVAIDRDTAEEEDIAIGQTVQLATTTGAHEVEVVGTLTFGGESRLIGARLFYGVLEDVQRWSDNEGRLNSVVASSEEGISDSELVARLEAVLPEEVEVRTGEASAGEQAATISGQIETFLLPALLALAGAAVIVGGFIIFNTASITVAQRTREFALLRTLGASRGQVLRAVTGEALLVAVVASALGLAAGAGFAELLTRLFEAAGFGLPATGVPIAARTIAIALVVGVAVSLLAAYVPARRATRVPPADALRAATLSEPPRRHRSAPWLAGGAVLLGALAVVTAALGDGPAQARLGGIGGGAILLFVGLALSARWLVRPLAHALGRPLERVRAVTGRLARENTERNPGRTAVTAAALMVGLALVVFIAVFADGLKASITGSLERLIAADHVVLGESQAQFLPAGVVDAAQQLPEVRTAAAVYFDQVAVGDRAEPNTLTDTIEGIDRDRLSDVYRVDWVEGSDEDLARFGEERALVEEQFARVHELEVGDRFRVTTPAGAQRELEVLATYRDPQILQGVIVDAPVFLELSSMQDPFLVFLRSEEGVSSEEVRAELAGALERYPATRVQTTEEYRQDFEDQLNQLIYLLYALLALVVVISLLGIANTLFLSVHERTRELGLLRALGADGRQIRQVVRYESVITAILGGLLGIAAGVGLGWVATEALADLGLVFSLPVGQLAVFVVLAALVGVLAASLPARRAARIDVLEALREE